MTENRLVVDAVESTIHLHWSGTADLDLIALVQQEDAEYHLISFANEGSLEHSPYIQLLSDFAFEAVLAGSLVGSGFFSTSTSTLSEFFGAFSTFSSVFLSLSSFF